MSASSDAPTEPSDDLAASSTSAKSPRHIKNDSMNSPPEEETTMDCIICLNRLPVDTMPLTGEYEPLAQLVPCSHFMHDHCVKDWIEVANSCPICRTSFNEVKVLPHMSGRVLFTYDVEDKVQSVADHGVEIPPEYGEEGAGPSGEIILLEDEITAARIQRQWVAAWEHLDADLADVIAEEDEDELGDYYERMAVVNLRQRRQRQRMNRRREVAAGQTGNGRNAFDEPLAAWTIPTTRPRESFPHLEQSHQMTREESHSWKMMELAEKIESSGNKRRRNSDSEERLLARMEIELSPDTERNGRKFKRPRTKRDSQLPVINTRVNNDGESSRAAETASAARLNTPSEAGSPPAGGIFTSILEGIGKSQDVPIVSAADVTGKDLTRMRPISPDCSSVTSAMSRSRSPPPSSPPSSRPVSPAEEQIRGRRPTYSPSSPTRTPAHSLDRRGKKPWEVPQPTSPPASRVQSPEGRSSIRHGISTGTSSSNVESSPASDPETVKPSEQPGFAITKQTKAEIMNMVSVALKPLYPQKISKVDYTDINRRISRRMYKLVCDHSGRIGNLEQTVAREVEKEVAEVAEVAEVLAGDSVV